MSKGEVATASARQAEDMEKMSWPSLHVQVTKDIQTFPVDVLCVYSLGEYI